MRGCSGFEDEFRHTHRRHSGMVRRTRPGISRFRVRCFASPRNDGEKARMTTVTITAAETPKSRIDWTRPVLWLFAAFMIVLIVLPLSWLAVFAFTDKARHPTLQNFVTLFTDPAFLDPLLTTAIIATTSAVICCLVAAPIGWLVSRTDMPGRQTIRALVTASFVTPPFLGAVAWELLAAPNSGLLNQLYRYLTGAEDPLFDIYSLTGLIFVISCYTFPFVFVLVANALDNMPGELEDASAILGGKAWTTARRVTIPLALPALVAGALVAFLQAMTLFGSPAILALPAGFHTMTTKIWSLFQYPPKLELAAAAAVPLLLLTILLLQGQKFLLGRRGFSAERHHAGDAVDGDAAQHRVRLHRIIVDPARAEKHRDPGRIDGDHRHDPCAGRRLCHDAPRDRERPHTRLS